MKGGHGEADARQREEALVLSCIVHCIPYSGICIKDSFLGVAMC